MPSLKPLASISCRITSIHVFFNLPCAHLTCLNLIRSTRRSGASVRLRRTWPNHRRRFSHLLFYRGYACLSTNILISHLISPRVTIHPTKHAHLCYTHLLDMISLYSQYSVPHNKVDLIAVQWNFPFSHNRMLRSHKTPITLLHFSQPAWIIWLTSLLISSSFSIIEPKYLK